MKSPLVAFVRKEFIHIFRDKRTMMILLLMPVVLIILFGYAITTEIKRVPIAILDQSRDEVTQKMISHFAASEYFELYKMIDSVEEGRALFRQGKVRMVLIVERGKGKGESEIQLLVDATDPNEATQLSAYATQIAVESGKLKVESENANSNAKHLSPFTFHLSTFNWQRNCAGNFFALQPPASWGVQLRARCHGADPDSDLCHDDLRRDREGERDRDDGSASRLSAEAGLYHSGQSDSLSVVELSEYSHHTGFVVLPSGCTDQRQPVAVSGRFRPLRLGGVVPGVVDLDDSRHPAGRHADQCRCPDAARHIA